MVGRLLFTSLSLVRKGQKRDAVQRREFRILVDQDEVVDYGCRCDPRISYRDFIAGFEFCRRHNERVVNGNSVTGRARTSRSR